MSECTERNNVCGGPTTLQDLKNHSLHTKTTKKKTKKAIRSAKRSYEKRIAKSGDKKPFHAYINSKMKSRIPVGPLKIDERTIIDNTEMAETLNTYFCSVFTKEDGGSLPCLRDMPFQYIIGSTEFSRNKVKEKLTKIKPSSKYRDLTVYQLAFYTSLPNTWLPHWQRFSLYHFSLAWFRVTGGVPMFRPYLKKVQEVNQKIIALFL